MFPSLLTQLFDLDVPQEIIALLYYVKLLFNTSVPTEDLTRDHTPVFVKVSVN